MQSGITGINTIRIYNPVKQSQDQDKDGLFIRQWISELAAMPHTDPYTMAQTGLAPDYPPPLVDEKLAANRQRRRLRHSPHLTASKRPSYY